MMSRTVLCLPCDIFNDVNPLVLANEEEGSDDEDAILDFDRNGTEFGADNCATHHICADRSLFVGDITPLDSVGVRGINGVSMANGVGTVKFQLKDDEGIPHEITL